MHETKILQALLLVGLGCSLGFVQVATGQTYRAQQESSSGQGQQAQQRRDQPQRAAQQQRVPQPAQPAQPPQRATQQQRAPQPAQPPQQAAQQSPQKSSQSSLERRQDAGAQAKPNSKLVAAPAPVAAQTPKASTSFRTPSSSGDANSRLSIAKESLVYYTSGNGRFVTDRANQIDKIRLEIGFLEGYNTSGATSAPAANAPKPVATPKPVAAPAPVAVQTPKPAPAAPVAKPAPTVPTAPAANAPTPAYANAVKLNAQYRQNQAQISALNKSIAESQANKAGWFRDIKENGPTVGAPMANSQYTADFAAQNRSIERDRAALALVARRQAIIERSWDNNRYSGYYGDLRETANQTI